jgi:hypothetical protein
VIRENLTQVQLSRKDNTVFAGVNEAGVTLGPLAGGTCGCELESRGNEIIQAVLYD